MRYEMTAKEYILKGLDKEENIFKEITRLSEPEKIQYDNLLMKLIDVNDKRKDYSDNEKGKALEEIVAFLFDKSSVFKVHSNIRTSTNEIDHLVTFNQKGKKFRDYIRITGEYFLSECKNYKTKIGVTWVGKFFSLLTVQPCKFGIIFSYHGLSGSGWNYGIGLTKKLFLTREKLEDRTFVIDFNIRDFERIKTGNNLLDIIEAKMTALYTDTNFSHHLTKHPADNSNEK